jgi:hypothetical protein
MKINQLTKQRAIQIGAAIIALFFLLSAFQVFDNFFSKACERSSVLCHALGGVMTTLSGVVAFASFIRPVWIEKKVIAKDRKTLIAFIVFVVNTLLMYAGYFFL